VKQTVRRALGTLAVLLAAFTGAGSPLPALALARTPLVDLGRGLAAMSSHAPGNVGIVVADLATGLNTGINAGANMPAASTIKIPVMVEVFRQMETGAFDLNRNVTLEASDRDWGSGDLANAAVGSQYPVSALVRVMITESDNTATNMLIRLVGRAHINSTMWRLGFRQTRLGDFIRSDGDIRSLRTSPLDMARLLEAMAHDQLIDAWASRAMIAVLVGQRHNSLLPEPLPPGTTIAHKTGTLHDTLNDVGIVYLNSEPYVIAVMTTHLPTLESGRRFIRDVSLLAYDELERFAAWREANMPPRLPLPSQIAPDAQMWNTAPSDATAAPLGSETIAPPLPVASPTPEPGD
jgi:beta-lactamase class A